MERCSGGHINGVKFKRIIIQVGISECGHWLALTEGFVIRKCILRCFAGTRKSGQNSQRGAAELTIKRFCYVTSMG